MSFGVEVRVSAGAGIVCLYVMEARLMEAMTMRLWWIVTTQTSVTSRCGAMCGRPSGDVASGGLDLDLEVPCQHEAGSL